MKKSILLAVLLVGAGVATSRAGVAFGINIDNGHSSIGGGYVSGGYPQQSYGYAYAQPSYGYSYPRPGVYSGGYGYRYDEHGALHHDMKHQHKDLHRDLNAEHRAAHRELNHQARHGANPWALEAEHDTVHHELSHEHQHGHADVRQYHRDNHYGYRW